MLLNIKAKFKCDECGNEFIVTIDPACEPPAGWTVFEVAEDAVRGGVTYEDERGGDVSSVQNELHLCSQCTRRHDAD
jgi:hypothetical protein